VPTEITQVKDGTPGELKVKYKQADGTEAEEIYNTVLFAIGRDVCTSNIGIENTGVRLNPK
jgi:pyruvate/2-oxoglutarate dehydrogenase complex dihydrolipoamide dehydrogenase (E3) component